MFDEIAYRLLNEFDEELDKYSTSRGSTSRCCLECAKSIAVSIARESTERNKSLLMKLLQKYSDATSSRRAIMNSNKDDVDVLIDDRNVKTDSTNKRDVVYAYNRVKKLMNAERAQRETADFPKLTDKPTIWIQTHWQHAMSWIRLQPDSMFCAQGVLSVWPFDIADSLDVFDEIVKEGKFYAQTLWERVPKKTAFGRAFLLSLSEDKIGDVPIRTLEEVEDLLQVDCTSKDALLMRCVLSFYDTPAEDVRPLIKHFTTLAYGEPDLTPDRALLMFETSSFRGTSVQNMVKLGYIDDIGDPSDNWEHYVTRKKRKT